MNRPLTATQVREMFEITDRVKADKEERRIRLERKQQEKQEYFAGTKFRATWEEE